MEQKKTLLIGMDLTPYSTQICYYDEGKGEAVPIAPGAPMADPGSGTFIPTLLGVEVETKRWIFGAEAAEAERLPGCTVVRDLLSVCESGTYVTLLGNSFSPEDLLERYLRRCLLAIRQQSKGQLIARLVVTVPHLTRALLGSLREAFARLGVLEDRVSFCSHGQSFGQFLQRQKREFLNGSVGLLQYEPPGFRYANYRFVAKRRPILAIYEEQDFSDQLPCPVPPQLPEESFTNALVELSSRVFHGRQVTVVYATGDGFSGTPGSMEALQQLAEGRRVFLGDMLFARGACYLARENALVTDVNYQPEFLFLTEETALWEVSMQLFYRGRMEEAVLCDAGVNWFTVEKKFDFILDETDQLTLTMTHILNHKTYQETFELEDLEKRPRKMTRIRLTLRYEDADTLQIQVEDLGFGEWFLSKGKRWNFTMRPPA